MNITEAYAMLIDRLGPGSYSIDIGTWNRSGKIDEVEFSIYAQPINDGRYTTDSHASLEDAVVCLIAKAGGAVSVKQDNNLDPLSEEAGRLAKDTERALSIITGG